MEFKKYDKYTKSALIIIVVAILLRFVIASVSSVTGDPCWVISTSRFMAENLKIPLFEPLGRPVFWTPPMFHFFAAFLYKISSLLSKDIANFAVKLVSPIFGSLSLIYFFFLTKKLYNSKIAFYSVIFLAFIPLHLYLSAIPYQDITVLFFVLASTYYLFDKKPILSGILAGIAISTKYTALLIFPLSLLVIYLKFDKKALKRALILFFIATIIFGSWWYIRNFVTLGNPVWPFLDTLIGQDKGINPDFFIFSDVNINIANLFKFDFIQRIYLSMYGVPGAGNISNLTFLKLPFLNTMLLIWFIATLLFTIPIIIYIFKIKIKDKRTWILLVWFFSFFTFAVVNKVMNDLVYIRHSMPLFVPLAIMWALGLNALLKKNRKKKNITKAIIIILALCIIGFSVVELVKAFVVSNTWGEYKQDFKWVEQNIPKNSIILVPRGDCYAYNFNKFTYGYYDRPRIRSEEKIRQFNVSHIWVNQEIDFYGPDQNNFSAAYPDGFIEILEDFALIYYNSKTATKIYQVNYLE